jgi:electron transport complex protein RnfG
LPIVLCGHQNQHLGWLSRIEAEGYAGTINILIGVNASNTITGLTILNHRETPGIGDIIEEEKSAWLRNFVNLGTEEATLPSWRLRSEGREEGGEIEAITGATITTTAVMQAIHTALITHPWSSTETGKILCKP